MPAHVTDAGNLGATLTLALHQAVKDWQNRPSRATRLNEAALEDLEQRARHELLVGTLTTDLTLTITGLTEGAEFTLLLTQDDTGSHTLTVTAGEDTATVPTHPDPGAITRVDGVYDGTTLTLTPR